MDPPIQRVPLDRFPPCLANQPVQGIDRQPLGGLGTGVVIDQLVHHGPVEIVSPKTQGGLRGLFSQHDPVRLDVIEVVEHDPRQRHHPQVSQAARRWQMVEPRILRVKRQWNERLESSCLILQGPQSTEMIDPVPRFLDVTVQHRGVGSQAQLVSVAMDVQPPLRVRLVLADPLSHFRMEDLRPTPGHAPQSRLPQLLQHPAHGLLRLEREPVDLDPRPRLNVQVGPCLMNHPHQVHIPVKSLLVMQPPHHVNLSRSQPSCFLDPRPHLVIAERVPLGRFQIRPERAEHASVDTHIGGVQVDVRVVVSVVAVLPFPHQVGQAPQGQQVPPLGEEHPLFKTDPLARLNLGRNLRHPPTVCRLNHRFIPCGVSPAFHGTSPRMRPDRAQPSPCPLHQPAPRFDTDRV